MGLLLTVFAQSAYRLCFNMVYEKFIEIGAVVYITLGHHKGKIAAIANVVDQNRVLVDGPCSDVPRCVVNLKQIQITKFRINIPFGYRTGGIKKSMGKGRYICSVGCNQMGSKDRIEKQKGSTH